MTGDNSGSGSDSNDNECPETDGGWNATDYDTYDIRDEGVAEFIKTVKAESASEAARKATADTDPDESGMYQIRVYDSTRSGVKVPHEFELDVRDVEEFNGPDPADGMVDLIDDDDDDDDDIEPSEIDGLDTDWLVRIDQPRNPWDEFDVERYTRGHNGQSAADDMIDELRSHGSDIRGMDKIIDEIKRVADSYEDKSWTCPVCNLTHNHDLRKHDIREIFDVREDFALHEMHFNPRCHCGVRELSWMGKHGGREGPPIFEENSELLAVDEDNRWRKIHGAADSAPVPDRVSRKLRDKLGR